MTRKPVPVSVINIPDSVAPPPAVPLFTPLPFDLTPAEARIAQQRIPPCIERRDRIGRVRTVAGADIALRDKTGYAAFIVYSFPDLVEIERVASCGQLKFPYVPGLLAFREIPLLLDAFAKLRVQPDLILADAHGWAHPRRAGMASHLGLLLDIPTIGCAKSVLVGQYKAPGIERGSMSSLVDKTELIGRAVRTRSGVKPVFVSCGHRVSLPTAVRLVLACSDGFRIPKPQREADRWVKQLRG
jgi:deoxyribonuclease V